MNYGSGIVFFIRTVSNIKWNKKSQKVKNERPKILGNNAASDILKVRFLQILLLLENRAQYCPEPESEPELEPEPEPEPKLFLSRSSRNLKKALRFHNTVCTGYGIFSLVTVLLLLQ